MVYYYDPQIFYTNTYSSYCFPPTTLPEPFDPNFFAATVQNQSSGAAYTNTYHLQQARTNNDIIEPIHQVQVKPESPSLIQSNAVTSNARYVSELAIPTSTNVDRLVRAIRAIQGTSEQDFSKETKASRKQKCYLCDKPNCSKSFNYKSQLEIHTRFHTGEKPFVCTTPGCGKSFSQLGNMKTHNRSHTSEKLYECHSCGKTFKRQSNLHTHKIVHQQIKPFACKLDDCGKEFTQLGNLKSHHNKNHAETLENLTRIFSTISSSDCVTPEDKELSEYFNSLYKNSNKGIKGRGKV